MIATALDKGVEAALRGCREAQLSKQREVLELGLRGLRADQKKFSHIPEIKAQIGQTIKAVEKAIICLNTDFLPEMYLEENIDIEERHAGETPLEFRMKQALNKAYKKEYVPLIRAFLEEKEKTLKNITVQKEAELKKIQDEHTHQLRTLDIHSVAESVLDELDLKVQEKILIIDKKYNKLERGEVQLLKEKHKKNLDDAKPIYDRKIMPLVKQLQIEIASKHFNASIQSLKKIFEEDKIDGLSIDVNSLTFYAFLSQTLDILSKLDLVSSIGLPFFERLVKAQIPEGEKQLEWSNQIATQIAVKAGQEFGIKIGDIVNGPLNNLQKAVEYSESMSVLEIPNSGFETPFMAYYVNIKKNETTEEKSRQVPVNFFQAIESVSKADGMLDTLGAIRGFYNAMTSGSAEGCLDDTENMFDSMNQGLRCELMRQRFSILNHTQAALRGFNNLPDDWKSFEDEVNIIMQSKIRIDNEFETLSVKYNQFKNQFNQIKEKYDRINERIMSEKSLNPNSEYVELENKKARSLISEGNKISRKLNKQFESVLKEEILKAKKIQYEKLFGAWEQKTTRDKKIIQYFLANPDTALDESVQSIVKHHQEKIQKLTKNEILAVADRLDKEYKPKIDVALQKVSVLQALEAQRHSFRKEMVNCSRAFYIESQKFKEARDFFNEQICASLGHIKALSTPDNNFHLWQLKNLALWSSEELAPLDVVIKLFDTLGDKIKSSAVKYSDIFALAAAEKPIERKMKAETGRGSAASFSDKVKQSTGNMLGSSIVELKAGEQMGYLSVFAQNIASTIATEHKVEKIKIALEEGSIAAKHAAMTHEATPISSESKGRLSRLFLKITEIFRSLNPFAGNVSEMQALQTARPAVLAAYSSDAAKTSKSRDGDDLKIIQNKTDVEIKTSSEKGRTKK